MSVRLMPEGVRDRLVEAVGRRVRPAHLADQLLECVALLS